MALLVLVITGGGRGSWSTGTRGHVLEGTGEHTHRDELLLGRRGAGGEKAQSYSEQDAGYRVGIENM